MNKQTKKPLWEFMYELHKRDRRIKYDTQLHEERPLKDNYIYRGWLSQDDNNIRRFRHD